MINGFTIKNIGRGECELKFKHNNTDCRFVITRGPLIFSLSIVFCFLFYKKLTKTLGGRNISIPLIKSGDHKKIRDLSERIDREIMRQYRDLVYHYSLIVKKDKARLLLPCQAWLKENGYPDDVYSTIVTSIKKCLSY